MAETNGGTAADLAGSGYTSGGDIARKVWDGIAGRLRKRIAKVTYQQFFQAVVPVGIEDRELHLGVPDDFFAEYITSHYGDLIGEEIASEQAVDKFRITGGFGIPGDEEVMPPPAPQPRVREKGEGGSFTDRYTFANFVIGEENRYAYSAVHAASEQPGRHNPLFIYGRSGTGKTHLVLAAANALRENHPELTVRYASCEEILNHYVDSLRNNTHSEFRSYMREVDVLIIDDVHQLANKNQLQEQFFNTFNALYTQNKQIILTCDRQPSDVQGLEPRLVSRFESGVTTEIIAPGFETRLAILKAMQAEQVPKIGDDVLVFIATNITANVRRLKGALLRLVAYSSMMQCTVTLQKAQEILSKLIEEERAARVVSVEAILQKVAEHFELHISELLGDRKLQNIAQPRMIAMYLARKLTNKSFPEIGAAFGKNHATVMNAMKKVPELCAKNESLRGSLEQIERQLKS